VDETRKTAEHELEALRSREEYVRELLISTQISKPQSLAA
jgi:hypothetical protein